jgi:hypothetical protein
MAMLILVLLLKFSLVGNFFAPLNWGATIICDVLVTVHEMFPFKLL